MAVLESKPFLAPSHTAVNAEIEVVEPASEVGDISERWEPGQRIVLRCRAELSPDFWTQTGISPDEEISLVGNATCLPARATWRSSASRSEERRVGREGRSGWTRAQGSTPGRGAGERWRCSW